MDDVEEMDIKELDTNTIEEILENLESDEPIVEGAKVECSRSPNKDATMRIIKRSNDTRNGNRILKDTDVFFSPHSFEQCKGNGHCLPKIYLDRWQECDSNNRTSGHKSVTKKSYMVCTSGGGLICVKENGQIKAEDIPYGKHLSVAEIKELINYFFNKMGWGAEEGNKWRILADRDPINWKSNPPGQEEIRLTFSERDPGLAWESSIGFWCFEGKGAHASINDYIVKYEMHESDQTDEGDEYTYDPKGLYFVVECYVNGAEVLEAGEMRAGNIEDYSIEGKGPTSYTYKYLKGKDPTKDFKAPNGIVDRAKKYMEYYDEEEPIWNFSDDIVELWEDIYT